MESYDLQFLSSTLASFIHVAISRVAHGGLMSYPFDISADQIRQATGRQRMTQQLIDDYVGFFARKNVRAEYDSKYASLNIQLDLNYCTLNSDQSDYLSTAMATYRAEHE